MSGINQQKLAKMAGVSVSTVSKAFSGGRDISEDTRRRIFSLARQYGCFDKYSRAAYEKRTVAVIAPEFLDNVYTQGISIIEQLCRDSGYVMLIAFFNYSQNILNDLISYFAEYVKVDGIIVLGGKSAAFPDTNVPIVRYGETHGVNKNIDSFSSDTSGAVELAVDYLAEQGHRDIAFIGELLTNAKLEWFKKAMRLSGTAANESFIRISRARFEKAGFEEMEKLIANDKRPTAIVCAYDRIAFGAIDAIIQHGFKVPEDFSVIGMNDVKSSVYSGIGLTTIREIPDDIFIMMFELLCKRMDGSTVPRRSITMQAELIKRKSVAQCRT